MNRIEVNVQTGEIKTIPLTQAELDAAAVRVAAEAARPRVKSELELLGERVTALETQIGTR